MPALPATITHQDAPGLVHSLSKDLRADASAKPGTAAQPWLLDAAALTHFDSSALAVLLECRRLADAQGRKVQLNNAPAKLGQLARLYGIEDLLNIPAEDKPAAAQA